MEMNTQYDIAAVSYPDVVRKPAQQISLFCDQCLRGWKVAPALACGCTIVMKPSELTPLTALVYLPPTACHFLADPN
jgi:hypothetical protein